MIQQSDIQGRLNLFRYGLVVMVVVTFLVALLVPFARTRNLPGASITDWLDIALIATVIVAILGVIIYFAYAKILQRTVAPTDDSNTATS